jgi:hypothetical protein
MNTLTPAAPALGSRYHCRATGRPWHVDHVSTEGVVCLKEEFYGPDCERRSYVSVPELAADYDPAP